MPRRDVLKALAAAGGAVTLSMIPDRWEKPGVRVGALPAFAQVTPASIGALVWQVGVINGDNSEFGWNLGRVSLTYDIPSNWAEMSDCTDCWSDFPEQLNPPEDWPNMPQTVHLRYTYPVAVDTPMLRVMAYQRIPQAERLRVSFDGAFVGDVPVSGEETPTRFDFGLPAITPGQHVITLENPGGGGTLFDYIQLYDSILGRHWVVVMAEV